DSHLPPKTRPPPPGTRPPIRPYWPSPAHPPRPALAADASRPALASYALRPTSALRLWTQ
ncbi:hypothetical protein C0993_000547, partial [Termitomyces sp. T159_Od127]